MDVTQVVFDLAWVSAVIGFFLPLVISFLKKVTWSDGLKKTLAILMCAGAGLVNTGVQAGWAFGTLGEFVSLAVFSIMDVYVTATVIYTNLWKGTNIDTALAGIRS